MEYRVICTKKKEKNYPSGYAGEVLDMFGIASTDAPSKMIYCNEAYIIAGIKAGDKFFVEARGNTAYLRINHTHAGSEFVETVADSVRIDNLFSENPCGVDIRVNSVPPTSPTFWQTISANPLWGLLPFLLGLLLTLLFCWLGGSCSKPTTVVVRGDTIVVHDKVVVHDTLKGEPCPQNYQVIAHADVLFKFNKYNLNELAEKKDLDTLKFYTEKLQGNPKLFIDLYGYADNAGTIAYNDTLSAHRERSVRAYFLKNGIDKSRIQVVRNFGKRINSTSKDPKSMAKDRKVEIRIYGIDVKSKP